LSAGATVRSGFVVGVAAPAAMASGVKRSDSLVANGSCGMTACAASTTNNNLGAFIPLIMGVLNERVKFRRSPRASGIADQQADPYNRQMYA
jgi:hypothetical protein